MVAIEQLTKGPIPRLIAVAHLPVQARHPVAAIMPLVVDRLIGGHRIEPRAELPLRLELVALEVDLQKGLLEYVLSHRSVTKVIPQISEKLPLIAVDQGFECRPVSSLPELDEQFLVALRGKVALRTRSPRVASGNSFNRNTSCSIMPFIFDTYPSASVFSPKTEILRRFRDTAAKTSLLQPLQAYFMSKAAEVHCFRPCHCFGLRSRTDV